MNNIHATELRGKGCKKIFLLLLCLCALITACGESSESEETVLIDSAYLVTTTTTNPLTATLYPPVPYPIEIGDEIKIMVGEIMQTYEDFSWDSIFPTPSKFSITNPEIVEGEGTICEIGDKAFSVLGKSPGSCSLKFPSSNGGIEGFIYMTVTVVQG